MTISFIIAIAIIIFGAIFHERISKKAMYEKNKKNNTGYYWGGIPRNRKTIIQNEEKNK